MVQFSPEESEILNVACTQCGCVCDDLTVRVDQAGVTSFSPGCTLAAGWYSSLRQIPAAAVVEMNGSPQGLETGLAAAVELLRGSRSPLIYGLSRSSTGGQRAACRLADLIGATIDTTASTCHAPSIMALQQAGEQTSSLGEIRNRSDLIVYWGSNPLISHPRHYSRIVEATGQYVPGGRKDRHVVVVDVRRTETAAGADTFLCVKPGQDFEVLWTLRALLRGLAVTDTEVGGVPVSELRVLAQRMQDCTYGAVFFGLGLSSGDCGHHEVEALLRLVTDLNAVTRFVARRMRVSGDVAGADSVLCWQTGYPFSVCLNRGYPRYNPGEFTAEAMLERRETDCVVLVGAESVGQLSKSARMAISELPLILLDYPNRRSEFIPNVRFNTAIYGVHLPGVAYRMDEVPIPLRGFLPTSLPSDENVLNRIADDLS